MGTAKDSRIEIRSSDEEKKEFEEAASLARMDLSQFMRFSARLYAQQIRQQHHMITLSKEEGLLFLNALKNPPEPNQRLKDALRQHEENLRDAE